MEIKSRLEAQNITVERLSIHISPNDRLALAETLRTVLKKAKPDRLEEYLVNGLIDALENPEELFNPILEKTDMVELANKFVAAPETTGTPPPQQPPATSTVENKPVDKVAIIDNLKKRLDVANEKTMEQFVKESIEYGQKSMGIKTSPKSASIPDFYDWLVNSRIISVSGEPTAR